MNCEKCGKELLDGYVFCPFCGTIVKAKIKPAFTNAEFLSFCRKEDFDKEYECFSKMEKDDIYSWLKEMHEGMNIFRIKVYYTRTVKYSGSGVQQPERIGELLGADDAKKIMTGQYRNFVQLDRTTAVKYEDFSFEIVESRLTKSVAADFDKKLAFWERSEAERVVEAIKKSISEYDLSRINPNHMTVDELTNYVLGIKE